MTGVQKCALPISAHRALGFYGIVGAATLGGAMLAATKIDPIAMLFWAAVINGIVAVPIMVVMMLLVSGEHGRQAFALPPALLRLGWLGAALKSMSRLQGRGYAEDIVTPLLVVGAGRDKVVHTQAIRDYVKRLPRARYVEIAESEHEVLMETDTVRAHFWSEFDGFIEQTLQAGPGPFGGARAPQF